MAGRVASFLACYLAHATGPKNEQLASLRGVEVKPIDFMQPLVQAALALHNAGPLLAEALAQDEQTGPAIKSTLDALRHGFLRAPFEKLAQAVEASRAARALEEPPSDDAPEEFLDALTYTVMRDPVRLPGSGSILDRATIERHLLDHQEDPFTRKPLTASELQPLPDLKARIEQWKAVKKQALAMAKH
jgi:ubiquitin conjugation factor E4 B